MQAILFDWGDTIMRVFPEYPGPMVEWPQVEPVPGVAEALAALHPQYRLALGTNAADSGEVLVRAALRRVGLEERLDAVYTARELGVRKPTPAFFLEIARRLGVEPAEVVMVGDEYISDVFGAKEAGLRAAWFNPGGRPCPEAHPRYDAEVRSMAVLPAAVEAMHLPDLAECRARLVAQGGDLSLLRHSQVVAAAAFRLAWRLRERGVEVDPLLAHRGGLLHDVGKVTDGVLNDNHNQVGAGILLDAGYPDLAEIVRRHLMSTLFDPGARPPTWEEKVVCYADKLTEIDRIVSMEERFAALRRRYPGSGPIYDLHGPTMAGLERELADRLGVAPLALLQGLDQAAVANGG